MSDPNVERFNQRNVGFSRIGWDGEHPARGKEAKWGPDPGRPNFTPEDYALMDGAWEISRRAKGMGEVWEPDEDNGPRVPPGKPNVDLTAYVKEAAGLFGAVLTGVVRLNPQWVYLCDQREDAIDIPEGMDSVVVMAVPMDYERIATAPSPVAAAATGNGYSRMAFATTCLAQFLTEAGYRAMPCGNDTALSIPLALDAGLGEYGRNGMLITESHGPRVRLCKVFTDAPLVPDEPVTFGVREFCGACMKCADECPAAAITRGEPTDSGPTPSNNPGIRRWFVNPDTCLTFWRLAGSGCSVCLRSCPFNKPPGRIHAWARALVRLRSRMVNRMLLWLDNALGYGKRPRSAPADPK